MGDAGPTMEVCPYCKKPFKRLKSHLPHCKMIRQPVSADQKAYQSKAATLSRTKKETRSVKEARWEELETESVKKTAKAEDRPEWTTATSPLLLGVLEGDGATKARGETKDQNQPSFQASRRSKPKVTLKRVTTPPSPPSDATSPKRELTRDESESKGGPCCPSETEAPSPVDSMEPFLSNEERKDSSAQPDAQPATSASLRWYTIDPQRPKKMAKLLDEPIGGYHSPQNGSHEVQRVRPSVLNRDQDGGNLSGVSSHPGNTETQEESESLLLDGHTGSLGKSQVREHQELGFEIELCQNKGNTENRTSATQVQEWPCLGLGGDLGSKDPISAANAKPMATIELLDAVTPPEGALSKRFSVPESGHQSRASLAVRSAPEEKAPFCGRNQIPAITPLVGSERNVLEPTSLCHAHTAQSGHPIPSYSALLPVSKISLFSHAAAADLQAPPPRSMGLEWFPELYPGYVGLGVLPRGPQPWSSLLQMPSLATSQGGNVWKVPWLGRSSADSKSLEPLALTTSSFPLMRLLGAVHKGWVRCNTTIKKSSVGDLTMLFAGYFILCCNWSFKHLKLQRWRKW